MPTDYSVVTELPGSRASREQYSRLYHRYHLASRYTQERDVLEVGCGAGLGLGYLSMKAKTVVGGDYDAFNLRHAHQYYQGRIGLLRLDAHQLPFAAGSFDVVIFFEAIYYLVRPELFLEECRRVLRKKGTLLVCTVNKEWSDFHPSPFSVRYFSAKELATVLREKQFEVELFGAYPTSNGSAKGRAISLVKKTASTLHLIPKTMQQKEILKRIFFGRLVTLSSEIKEGAVEYRPPIPISADCTNCAYKVVYAVARAQ